MSVGATANKDKQNERSKKDKIKQPPPSLNGAAEDTRNTNKRPILMEANAIGLAPPPVTDNGVKDDKVF